jgi:hypothetical protein
LNQTSATARVIVPPRPNLGPEPWSETRTDTFPLLVATLAVGALLLGAAWIIRRRRASRRLPSPPVGLTTTSDDTPAARLLSLAGQARETLAARFGPSLRARTTEEIAADPQLREALGETHFDPLIRLLATADRWKFAPSPENGQGKFPFEDFSRWEAWSRTLPAEPPSKTKAR